MSLLDRYFTRIGLQQRPPADPAGLAALVRAHRLAIPFENFDIPLGHGIAIDLDSVAVKLLDRRRGGYCFEQNALLGAVLQGLGITARPLLARVRLGLPDDATPPRTHTFSLVDLQGALWTVDGGFGGSHVPPMRLAEADAVTTPDGVAHRFVRRSVIGSLAGEWLLQRKASDRAEWEPQYSFDLAEVAPEDLDLANHWTSSRPGTRFTSQVIASRVLPDGFLALTGRVVSRYRGDAQDKRDVADAEALRALLDAEFGLAVDDAAAKELFAFTPG